MRIRSLLDAAVVYDVTADLDPEDDGFECTMVTLTDERWTVQVFPGAPRTVADGRLEVRNLYDDDSQRIGLEEKVLATGETRYLWLDRDNSWAVFLQDDGFVRSDFGLEDLLSPRDLELREAYLQAYPGGKPKLKFDVVSDPTGLVEALGDTVFLEGDRIVSYQGALVVPAAQVTVFLRPPPTVRFAGFSGSAGSGARAEILAEATAVAAASS